jgi:hypothetical protein
MANDTWRPALEKLSDVDAVETEWKNALAAKGSIDLVTWEDHVTKLREAAALLRDTLVPVAATRERLSALVDEMSQQLPERRGARRPEP